MLTGEEKQREMKQLSTPSRRPPEQGGDMPAAERKTNLAVLLELCCVLKDGLGRLGTAQEPLAEAKVRTERQLALHP